MNSLITRFEINYNYKSIIPWTIVSSLFALVFTSMYDSFSDSIDSFSTLLESFPKEVIAGFNINFSSWGSFNGYFTYALTFLSLVYFLFSAILTLRIFNKEFRHKSIDFLFTKPLSKFNIYHQKMLAVLILNICFFIITIFINILLITIFVEEKNISEFIFLNLSLFILQIFAMSFSGVIATTFQNIRGVGNFGFLIAIFFFALNVLGSILEYSWLQNFSVFGLFDLIQVLDDGYPLIKVFAIFGVSGLLYILGAIIYKVKDVS